MKEIASRQDVLNIFYAKIFAADPPQPPLTGPTSIVWT